MEKTLKKTLDRVIPTFLENTGSPDYMKEAFKKLNLYGRGRHA